MTNEEVNSTHPHESGRTVKDGADTQSDLGDSSNGSQVITENASMTIAMTEWYLSDGNIKVGLPVESVDEIMSRVNSDVQVGMSMAVDFFSKAPQPRTTVASSTTVPSFCAISSSALTASSSTSREPSRLPHSGSDRQMPIATVFRKRQLCRNNLV